MNIDAIDNAIDFLHDLQGVSGWRNNSTTSNNRYMAELARTIEELEQFKTEISKEAAEKGYDMTNSEYYARIGWDKTCEERDELRNQVKALSAIKRGLEKSLTEAFKTIEQFKAEQKQSAGVWVDVKDGLPKSEQNVLFYWKNGTGKDRISKGFYVANLAMIADQDVWEDFGEYNEEKDEYFVPEGWYESGWESEMIYEISNVTYWMSLPQLPDETPQKQLSNEGITNGAEH